MKFFICFILVLFVIMAQCSASKQFIPTEHDLDNFELAEIKKEEDGETLIYVREGYDLSDLIITDNETTDIEHPELDPQKLCIGFKCKIKLWKLKICICIGWGRVLEDKTLDKSLV